PAAAGRPARGGLPSPGGGGRARQGCGGAGGGGGVWSVRGVGAPPAPPTWTERMFGASWLSYFSYYFTRKNLSVTKKRIHEQLGLSTEDLRDIDTAFLSAYAIGQVVNGFLADRIGPRRMVGFGMIASSLAAIAFPFTDRVIGAVLGAYFAFSAVNGLVQSTGWPGNGKLMASWFSTARRGEIMGWWSTCYQAGGLCATWAASWLLGFGWRAAYVVP